MFLSKLANTFKNVLNDKDNQRFKTTTRIFYFFLYT